MKYPSRDVQLEKILGAFFMLNREETVNENGKA